MSDVNVSTAQHYLNAMFSGNPNWVDVVEDGITGTATMQAIVRAFQINNNIGSVTGTIGPLTIAKMKSLPTISKMNPNDPSSINVCLIQCALFCKGYNAGGVTGIYYNTGEAAVIQYQSDAGLTQTGIIDWKVWLGLLSLNWFTLATTGDSDVRTIQRNLNRDYSNVIGVIACDGIVSRMTVLSLIGALQAEEGVTTDLIVDLNTVNFGVATTANFPSTLKKNQNSDTYRGYNRIAQYGLYFNGYNPGNFDGYYTQDMEDEVSDFQSFYKLDNIGLVIDGEVNVSVMKSLLTSKGDTNRTAYACDCATILNQAQAQGLVYAGYTHVGRYLTGYVGAATRKFMTFEEIAILQNKGLKVFPIYQDGGYNLEYFIDGNRGVKDAHYAINAANRIGVPAFTTLYFAVDFDCYQYQVDEYIVPYFEDINLVFGDSTNTNINHYNIGVYGPRYVCQRLYELELTAYSFVADMSSGFSCNLGFGLPSNWSFDQFVEFQFSSSPSFDLDKDAYSGRDVGISEFDETEYMTPLEMEEDNEVIMVDNSIRDYVLKASKILGGRDYYVTGELRTGIERTIGTYNLGLLSIEVVAKIENQISDHSNLESGVTIGIDQSGNLSSTCETQISEIEDSIDLSDYNIYETDNPIGTMLRQLSLSLRQGEIMFRYTYISERSFRIDIVIESGDLFPSSSVYDDEVAIEYGFIISVNNLSPYKVKMQSVPQVGYNKDIILFIFVLLLLLAFGQIEILTSVIILMLIDKDLLFEDEEE